MSDERPTTVWVLGDQLNRGIAPLAGADPSRTRVLLVESDAKLASKRWHRQRLHLVLAGMRRFGAELADEGFAVDHRRARTLASGLRSHRREHRPERVVATSSASWSSATWPCWPASSPGPWSSGCGPASSTGPSG